MVSRNLVGAERTELFLSGIATGASARQRPRTERVLSANDAARQDLAGTASPDTVSTLGRDP